MCRPLISCRALRLFTRLHSGSSYSQRLHITKCSKASKYCLFSPSLLSWVGLGHDPDLYRHLCPLVLQRTHSSGIPGFSPRKTRILFLGSGDRSTVSKIQSSMITRQSDTSSGDVIHLKVLGKHIIVLNSYKAASELLDNRGAKYSSRPRFPLHEM